jgi:large subunit ribosomal protein L22
MRRVAALVKGMSVRTAEQVLRHVPKGAAVPLAMVIKSATANALAGEGTGHHKADDLVVADVRVDGGPIARRFRATGMGRAYRIRKRYCHVRVTVSDAAPVELRRQRRAKTRSRTGAPSGGEAKSDAR